MSCERYVVLFEAFLLIRAAQLSDVRHHELIENSDDLSFGDGLDPSVCCVCVSLD